MATEAQLAQIKKYEAASNDKSLPSDVREQMWQKAVDLKEKAAGFAKGGAVKKKPTAPKAVGKMLAKAPAKVPAKLAKGGAVKKGKC